MLPAGRDYTPVNVAVWDSGVDTALFRDRLVTDGGKPAVIAFDRFAKPANTASCMPIPTDVCRAACRR